MDKLAPGPYRFSMPRLFPAELLQKSGVSNPLNTCPREKSVSIQDKRSLLLEHLSWPWKMPDGLLSIRRAQM